MDTGVNFNEGKKLTEAEKKYTNEKEAQLPENKDKIKLYGFNKGYDMYVIFVILCQAAVGLSVAMVVKYADNIHKGFASSISIMIACVIEAYTFGETIIKYDAFFTGSLFIVICSAIFLHQHFKYNYVDTKLVRNSAIEQL